MAAVAQPRNEHEAIVVDVWRGNGRREGTMVVYLQWVRRYRRFCGSRREGAFEEELTLAAVTRFARSYAAERRVDLRRVEHGASVALRAWALGLRAAGVVVPDWRPAPVDEPLTPLFAEFVQFRRHHAGVAESTVNSDLRYLRAFVASTGLNESSFGELRLTMIDDFVTAAAQRWARKTVARACTAIRAFLRFLHYSGRAPHDLASSVVSPVVHAGERPPRALPWEDVRRLLAAIDPSRRAGLRDRALLLMMAIYGMGTAEVLQLDLDDIGWRTCTLRLVRPKTGAPIHLPLLPAVGEALATYIQDERPRHASSRHIFVAATTPHGPMSPSAVRHVVRVHARVAGLATDGERLGGHVLRHSHATRQVELGVPLAVLGDILGHQAPASTSAYVRVATSRLRELALPVPT